MKTGAGQTAPATDPSPEEFAEAAAWVARMHGPNRTLQAERGFRRWLDAKPEHASAFEAMTAAWDVTAQIPKEPLPHSTRWRGAGYREGFIRSAIAVVALAAVAVGIALYIDKDAGIATGVGEQRVLTLEDGSRVVLNTATRVVVNYDSQVRKVELKNGEAFFDVAQRADRPFVVEAAGRQVRALGTSFTVRNDAGGLAVTLVEGKVAISPTSPNSGEGESGGSHYLSPGQRLTAAAHRPVTIDTPAIEKVTAWRRGLVDFQNTPLRDAVAEMNRYTRRTLTLEDSSAAAIAITGVFRAGDTESFAAAVRRAYQVELIQN